MTNKAKLTLTLMKEVSFHDGKRDHKGIIVDYTATSVTIRISDKEEITIPFNFINYITK